MKTSLPLFALGLALGGITSWRVLSSSELFAPGSLLPAHPPAPPAWSWRDAPLPPTLAPDAIGPALAAWRTLRSPDGSPVPYATRAAALRSLVARLPAADFPRLLATFAATPDVDERRLRQLAFDVWTDLDPAAATRWAVAVGKDLRVLALQCLRAWAALDAPAAAAWACALRDDEAARALAGPALVALAARDSARAIALANSRDDAFRDAVLPALLSALSQADPAATVLAFAPSLWKDGRGFNALRGPLAAWARLDPDAALVWLTAQPGYGTWWIQELALTPTEYGALATALTARPELPNRGITLGELFFRWGLGQPAEALAWLGRLADPDQRLALLESASQRYYRPEHPEQSLPFVFALPAGQNRTEKLGRRLSEWARIDRPAALAWVAAHDEPAVTVASYAMQATLLAAIARDEPATALAEWKLLPDPRAQKAALIPIVQAWGQTDPAAALQWGTAQNRSLDSELTRPLLSAWAQKAPEAALRWAETRALEFKAEGKVDYPYLLLYSFGNEYAGHTDRAVTADLFAKIQDPALRAETLTKHVAAWQAKDPAAAKAWLEKSDSLAPEQVARLLNPAAPAP